MSYATEADLIAWCGLNGEFELTELTDPHNLQIDHVLVEEKLEQADNECNARLIGVPLPSEAPYPKLLVDIACRIARYFLYTTGRPQYVIDDYEYALRLLDDIRTGKATLGPGAGGEEILSSSMGPAVRTRPMVFTEDLLSKL